MQGIRAKSWTGRGKGDGRGGKGLEEDEAMDEWEIVEEVSLTIPASSWSRNAKERSVNTVVRTKILIMFVCCLWYDNDSHVFLASESVNGNITFLTFENK